MLSPLIGLAGLLSASNVPTAIEQAAPASMERHHAPGAVVVFVTQGGGEIIRTFGVADAETKRPVDPDRTAFRTGSISKVFTGMAAQILVAEGRLSLEGDANKYLRDFRVPEAFGKPVTLRSLLTHTAGFDDRYIGKSARTFDGAQPLNAFLQRFLPPRVIPPGEIYTYSNLGIALAGLLVENASGRPFAEYVEQAIFRPLGMEYSSFLLPERIRQSAALPHRWTGSGYESLPWDYLQDAPAGMHMGSGRDMARLIQWALEHQDHAVFQQLFTNHPRLGDAAAWGWHLGVVRGRPSAGHDGGYAGVRARLRVVFQRENNPGFGYFIAVNSASEGVLYDVEKSLLDALGLPENPPTEQSTAKPAKWDRDVSRFSGSYRPARYSRTSLTKVGVLIGMLGRDLRIGTTADGTITMPKLDGSPRRMVQVEPLLFQSLDDDYFCAFRSGEHGAITHLFTSGTSSLEKVPWFETLPFQRTLCAVTFVLLMAFSFHAIRRRVLDEPLQRPVGWVSNLLMLHGLGLGLVLILTPAIERESGFMYGLPWSMWIVQTLPLIAVACTVWLIVVWVRSKSVRSFATLAVLATGGYLWFLNTWSLLGYRF